MRGALFVGLLVLAGCAADSRHASSSLSDGSIIHTVRCEGNWDACYLAASRICGDPGFEEVAREVDTALSTSGRLERMHTTDGHIEQHRYSESVQEAGHNRVVTIRCNSPR